MLTRRKVFRLALGIAIAALFIWLTLRQVDLARIAQVLRDARIDFLVAATALLCVGYCCRIARWRTMLARDNPALRFIDCAGPLVASAAANSVLPFRAGDIMRAFAFNGRLSGTAGSVLATIFVERLLDLLVIIMLLGVALWSFHLDLARLLGFGGPLLVMASGVILLVLLYPAVLQPVVRLLGFAAARLPAAARLQAELKRATNTLGKLAGGSTMWQLIAWSCATWIIEGGVFWLVALSLVSIAAPVGAWLALPAGTMATAIPSTPGYVGTFHYFTAQAMALAGNDKTASAAYAFLVHIVLWLPPTVSGGLYLAFRPAQAANAAGPGARQPSRT